MNSIYSVSYCTPDECGMHDMSINCIVILQHLLLLVRCIHQNMPIVITLSPELKVPVPTVGAIHQEVMIWVSYISTVMISNLN